AHCREVAKLELGDCGADLGDAADDLVSGDAGVDSRHHAAPFVARLVEIGVTNAAIQNFDLYILRARLTAKDRGARETRCWASSSIRFRDIASFPLRLRLFFERDRLSGFVHFLNLLVVHNFRCPHHRRALAEHANLLAKRANVDGKSEAETNARRGWSAITKDVMEILHYEDE